MRDKLLNNIFETELEFQAEHRRELLAKLQEFEVTSSDVFQFRSGAIPYPMTNTIANELRDIERGIKE